MGLAVKSRGSLRLLRNLSLPHFSWMHHRAPDYYAILGVSKHADLDEVKFAYFNMAKKFHPDLNKTLDAKQMFSLIAEAYDVLSDDARRAKYDETGLSEDRFGGTSTGPGRQSSDSAYTAEQMYQTIFGQKAKEEGQEEHAHEDFAESMAGDTASREYIVQVSAEEAVRGVRVGLQLRLVGICDKCNGSRSELGYTGRLCPYCEGTGQETIKTGHITARKTCSYCNGEKIFIKFKCMECEGLGRRMYDVYHPVDIPPGTTHGEVIRVEVDPRYLETKQGGFGDDQRLRDLFVTVDVASTEEFSVDGRDIMGTLELGPALAVLGGAITFPTPAKENPILVTVSPSTSSHTCIVLPGEGLPSSSLAGDLVLKTSIRVPLKLSWRQARIWKRFANLEVKEGTQLGMVEGVESELSHRLGVNIVSADKISNPIVKAAELKGFDETILEALRKKMGWEKPSLEGRHISDPRNNMWGI